jgi:Helix-turn-helix domain
MTAATKASRSQSQRILRALQAAGSSWTPSSELSKSSLQYGARIFELRKQGWLISSRVEIRDGVRLGFFRLSSAPTPRRQEIPTTSAEPEKSETLFGDIARDRTYLR